MLREIAKIQQHSGEHRRRWFAAESMDLFVWFDDAGAIVAFQLAYDKPYAERAITWKRDKGFLHTRVDDGVKPGGHPGTPLLVADGNFDIARVAGDFRCQAHDVDAPIMRFILMHLQKFRLQVEPPMAKAPDNSLSFWQGLRDLLKRLTPGPDK